MPIAIQAADGATVVLLQGQINSGNAAEVEAAVLELIEGGVSRLILDCSMLEYISSAGLRVVLIAARRLKGNGGLLVLCTLQATVREVLDITGLLPILAVEASRDDALLRVRGVEAGLQSP